jgi:WD40 repeat protein
MLAAEMAYRLMVIHEYRNDNTRYKHFQNLGNEYVANACLELFKTDIDQTALREEVVEWRNHLTHEVRSALPELVVVKELATLEGADESVDSVAFSPDGKTLMAGCDNTIKGWNVGVGIQRGTLASDGKAIFSNTDYVHSVAFSRDGKMMAAGGLLEGTIKLWDVATGRSTTLQKDKGPVCSVAFSPDGKTLASAGKDGTIKLWEVATGKERATLRGHTNPVSSVAFSPDGKTLASGSRDGRIKLWDAATGMKWTTLKRQRDWLHCVAFSPDGKTLASACRDGEIKLWDVNPQQ